MSEIIILMMIMVNVYLVKKYPQNIEQIMIEQIKEQMKKCGITDELIKEINNKK
jgi:hypothetical protein